MRNLRQLKVTNNHRGLVTKVTHLSVTQNSICLFQPQEPRGLVRRETPSEKENATLYHVFPHNQHLFQLPECASQQVSQRFSKCISYQILFFVRFVTLFISG